MSDFSQELVKDFLDEAFDLLDGLEKSLLTLESDIKNDKAINEVFRIAHTIKGGAGTVGFPEIQELMHTMEDVLDLVRKKTLSLEKDDINLLLQCRDELEKMLNAREKKEVFISPRQDELKKGLIQMKQGRAPVAAKAPQPSVAVPAQVSSGQTDPVALLRFDTTDTSRCHEAQTQGKKVYAILYHLNEAYEMRDVSGFQIYALLNDISEIIKIEPGMEALEKAFFPELGFLIQTDAAANFIEEKTLLREIVNSITVLEITPEKLRDIEDHQLDRSDAKAVSNLAAKTAVETPAENAAAEPQKPVAEAVPVEEAAQKRNVASLRVESWKIDELLNLLGELVITKASITQINTEFDRIGTSMKSVLKDFVSGITKLPLSTDKNTNQERNELLQENLLSLFNTFDNYSESIQKLNRISSSLQENVMAMRMVPIQMVFSRFPRLIRDMADKLTKKIELIIEGVETEIDKGMVEDLFDPLIHILRNAVDHGIEMPDERAKAGKPEIGKIVLRAVHEGDSIAIEVSDDGAGIDVDRIKKKAIEGGFVTRDAAEKMSQREILSLIFLPGLSTAKKVTDLSGRGVGMDVVKKKIEEIGGSVGLATVLGKGSRIVIRLPLTLAIIQGLLIVVKNMHYVLPVASVEETVIVSMKDLKEINDRLTLELRGKFIPVLSLMNYFYNEPLDRESTAKEYCIVAKYGDSFVGIIVSEVIGEQDIVIKPLNTKLIKSPGISAATIIGNGEIGYIIDTGQIIAHYFKKGLDSRMGLQEV